MILEVILGSRVNRVAEIHMILISKALANPTLFSKFDSIDSKQMAKGSIGSTANRTLTEYEKATTIVLCV